MTKQELINKIPTLPSVWQVTHNDEGVEMGTIKGSKMREIYIFLSFLKNDIKSLKL